MYPAIDNAVEWLVDYLSQPGTPLSTLAIPNVWNNAKSFTVRRILGTPLGPTQVRPSLLSGRTAEGVIYVGTDATNFAFGSIERKRFTFNKNITVTLYARYDGDESNSLALEAALGEYLLKEAAGNLGNNADFAAPQPLGGDLPDTEIRIQVIRFVLVARFQAIID